MTYNDLALAEEEGKLEAALEASRNLLIEAPTGSGKSLFIPYFLSKHCKGRIVVLQPRRIAALSLAQFSAKLHGEPCGKTVGYQFRQDSCKSAGTRILFQTYGNFLQELLHGKMDADWVVFDEYHERKADMDLLFGYFRRETRYTTLGALPRSECYPLWGDERREGHEDEPHNLRFVVPDKVIQWHDSQLGDFAENPKLQCGDFPIRDREDQWTYQFAVCVDDIDEGITHIVRGEDIRSSTARQIALREALGATERPVYLHHALIADSSGKKLSKRELAYSLRQEREAGTSPETLLGRVCFKAKLQESPTPLSLDQAISLIESRI